MNTPDAVLNLKRFWPFRMGKSVVLYNGTQTKQRYVMFTFHLPHMLIRGIIYWPGYWYTVKATGWGGRWVWQR